MLGIERQQHITNRIRQNGKVTISELVSLFGVSAETIRKDLLFLEQEGILKRTHGGAVTGLIHPLSLRKQERVSQKAELCQTALSFIREGDTIALDSGSTSLELAKLLPLHFHSLTVVTHSLEVFHYLSCNSLFRLILCGGSYIREESAFAGHLTEEAVKRVHTQKVFLFPSGISPETGITDYLECFIPIQKAYLDQAEQVFILADSEKYEHTALIKLDDARPEYTYITDSNLKDVIYNRFREKNILINRPQQQKEGSGND